VPRGEVSWQGYARYLLEVAGELGWPLKAGPDAVRPLTTAEYPTPARRPANSLLCGKKLETALGRTMPRWQDGVRAAVEALAAADHA